MSIIVDRLSDNVAVLEFDGEMIEVPRSAVPVDCKEGDVLGFAKLDNSADLKAGNDRLSRMRAKSGVADNGSIDL